MEQQAENIGTRCLQAALKYVRMGLMVIALKMNAKCPLPGSHGYKDATKSEDEVRALWQKYPNANVGIVTGRASGLFVVDCDGGEAGGAAWAELCRQHGAESIKTLEARTVSGGRHLFFRYPAGQVELGCGVRKIPFIDTRGEGGYVVAAPSWVDDPNHSPPLKGGYQWIDESVPIAEMPTWLIALYQKTVPRQPLLPEPPQAPGTEFVEALLAKYLRLASVGNRNHQGLQLAIQLRDNGVSKSDARIILERYAASVPQGDSPYTTSEALNSLNSAYSSPPREPSFRSSDAAPVYTQTSAMQLSRPLCETAPADHEGHFQVFKDLYGARVCFTPELGWLAYVDGWWSSEYAGRYVSEGITATLRKRQEAAALTRNDQLAKRSDASRSNIEAIRAIAQERLTRHLSEFNTQPELLNCKNGVLNLKTLELLPHDPSYLLNYRLEVNWNPYAELTEWLGFINASVKSTEDNEAAEGMSTAELLQFCAGYSISGDTRAEAMFYIFGPPRSGKGTFMSALQLLLGPLSSAVNIGTLCTSTKSDSQNFTLAALSRCRYVTAAETGRDTYLDPGRIKNLTGNDPIQCAFKFKASFSYIPKFKIWISSNHELNMDSSDDAAWDRVRVFQFRNSHKDAPDTSLKARLTTNLEPVLLWCARGAQACFKLFAEGRTLPKTAEMVAYIESRKDEADYIKHFLEHMGLLPGNDLDWYRPVNDLYSHYTRYFMMNNLTNPMSSRNFTSELKRRGFPYRQKKHQGKNIRVFLVTETIKPGPMEGVWETPL